MLRWKTYKFPTINNGVESLTDLLGGQVLKKRVIQFVTGTIDADIYLRVYRNTDLVCDMACDLLTTGAPLLPMNVEVQAGDIVKVGFYNVSAGAVTPSVAIGYEEIG